MCLLAGCSSESPQHVNDYEIYIRRWGGLVPDKRWYIMPDSVLISYTNPQNNQYECYVLRYTPEQKQQLKQIVESWDIDEFEPKNVSDVSVDCNWEFDFAVTLDSASRHFHVYMEKIDEMYVICSEIDKMLPPEHQVGYDEKYFNP